VKRQLLVPVAVFGAAHAADSRHARLPAGLRDQTARVTGHDVESPAGHGAPRASGDARGIAPCASVAGWRHGRQRPLEDDQRAVGPPGAKRGVNLQPERSRSPQPRRAPQALKRDERPRAERKVSDVPNAERIERLPHGARDHPFGVAVERIGGAVGRLQLTIEAIEEGGPARADEQRTSRGGQQLGEDERPGRRLERRGRERKKDVQAESTQRARQRRQQLVG